MSISAVGSQKRFSPAHPADAEASPSLVRRLLDLVLGPKVANGAVALAILIGFFHGWLKLKIRHPIATFLFDIPLMLALAITVTRLKSFRDWFPPCKASRALMVFYGVIVIWFCLAQVLPWGAPLLASLAAVRGWAFSTLMLGLGYHIVVSRRQLHGYFIWIILLAAITAFYATRQSLEEVQALRALDPYYEIMTRGQNFVDDEGRLVLRRFSTFISSGAFGGTMAVSLLFLAALLTEKTVSKTEKLVLLVLGLVIGWGMSLSGSRSAMVALAFGLIIIIRFRRLPGYLWLFGLALAAALALAARATEGGIWDRLAQLDWRTVWGRFYVVWAPGTKFLIESGFVGGGLGKAAVGLPISLINYIGVYKIWGVDGDLGKTMAELGIVGVGVVAWLLLAGVYDGLAIVWRHRDNSLGTLALGAFSCFAIAVVTFPIGSPFIGIPLGVLTWFFLGAAIRLDQSEASHRPPKVPVGAAALRALRGANAERGTVPPRSPTEQRPTPPRRQTRRFLFRASPTTSAEPDAPGPPAALGSTTAEGSRKKPAKRFLFR